MSFADNAEGRPNSFEHTTLHAASTRSDLLNVSGDLFLGLRPPQMHLATGWTSMMVALGAATPRHVQEHNSHVLPLHGKVSLLFFPYIDTNFCTADPSDIQPTAIQYDMHNNWLPVHSAFQNE